MVADSIERIVLGLAFGGLGLIAFKLLAEHFTGVSARAWALAQILAGLVAAAIGAWLFVQAGPASVREARCRVFETDIQETVERDDDGERRYLDVMVRVRWKADGRTFTLRRPTRLKQVPAKSSSREELAASYRPGHELRCAHLADRPDYILLAPPEEVLLRRRTGGLAYVLAGCVVVVMGGLRWRRAPDGRVRVRGGSGGLTGLALVTLVVGGLILRDAGSTWLGTGAAVLGVAGFVALLVKELIRERSALEQVRRRLKDAEHWPDPTRSTVESAAINLYEDDRVTGLLDGARVWASLEGDGASLEVELAAWPEKLEARSARARDDTATATGDEEFDDRVALFGPDPIWRPLLTATVRRQLKWLVGEKGGAIDAERKLKIALAPTDVDDLPWLVGEAAALARSLPAAIEGDDQACARVFELARSEPVAGLRFSHYRWLLARNWNAAQVLRTAARDANPDIAEWARSRLPPSFGTYR